MLAISVTSGFLFKKASKQSLINIGFPPIVATYFYEKFGKNAYLFGRWFKDYHNNHRKESNKEWWYMAFSSLFRVSLYQYTDLYEAGLKSPEAYALASRKYDNISPDVDFMEDHLKSLKKEIWDRLDRDIFFTRSFIKDILNNTVKDLKAYTTLSFKDAQDKYLKKKTFEQTPALKTYPNGWRWINVSDRSELVGEIMRNCGSASIMSSDKDRTIMVLFDSDNDPHVITTYSPNQKRISHVEGKATTPVKPEYVDYVIDLCRELGATFDTEGSKSKHLSLKSMLEPLINSIEETPDSSEQYPFFKLNLKGLGNYYSDGSILVPEHSIHAMDNFINKPVNNPKQKPLQDLFINITKGSHARSKEYSIFKCFQSAIPQYLLEFYPKGINHMQTIMGFLKEHLPEVYETHRGLPAIKAQR
jgi:hypothetical protein